MDNFKTWPEKIYLHAEGKIDLTAYRQGQNNSVVIFGVDNMPTSVLYIRADLLSLPTVEKIAKIIFETDLGSDDIWEQQLEGPYKESYRNEARAVLALLENRDD